MFLEKGTKTRIEIRHYDVFHALSALDSRKAYGSDGVPPGFRWFSIS